MALRALALDSLAGMIAPHQCIACGREGHVLCDVCILLAGEPIPSKCAGCHKLSNNYKTCDSCKSWLKTYATFVMVPYEGIYEQLVRTYKFDLKRQAVKPIARLMNDADFVYSNDAIVCPVPTAPTRIRQRGFDHSKLLAREFVKQNGMKSSSLLKRKTNVRQLGSTRTQRLLQMSEEFYVEDKSLVEGQTILLLDDVMTTGATISAAAKTLKKAGARRVYAIVFAQKQ